MMVKRTVGLGTVIALMLGVMALPVSAGQGVGAIIGEAKVGLDPLSECTKQPGDGEPDGMGLHLVDPLSPPANGYYRLNVVNLLVVLSTNGDLITNGGLDICGELGPEANTGIGAACGMSQGSNGTGKIFDDDGSYILGVKDVGWPFSVAGTLPVSGTIWRQHDDGSGPEFKTHSTWEDPKTKSKERILLGVVQAQGGSGCFEANGTKFFTVVGVFAFL